MNTSSYYCKHCGYPIRPSLEDVTCSKCNTRNSTFDLAEHHTLRPVWENEKNIKDWNRRIQCSAILRRAFDDKMLYEENLNQYISI